jgi:hypothetical protein
MATVTPIPSGKELQSQWESNKPAAPPNLPASWTASVLLSPFGDSISPLENPSQLVLGTIEVTTDGKSKWMRTRLYLAQSSKFFDFVFVTFEDETSKWFWSDSTPNGKVNHIYGPFITTVQVPATTLLAPDTPWGNSYPLMCTSNNPTGVACDHWVLPTRGASDHGSWLSFRRDTGNIFRVFAMDSTNATLIPVLGSFYIANLPSMSTGITDETEKLLGRIRNGESKPVKEFWNPLVTQEDIHRAMAFPLAYASCTIADMQAVIPGFVPVPPSVPLPQWTNKTYIEGWTLGTDFIPYWTRVCYQWTGTSDSKQQTVFVGLGLDPGKGNYLERSDNCLDTSHTDQPYLEWDEDNDEWVLKKCQDPIPGVGLPRPDWVARDGGIVAAQISGNRDFGLASGEVLNVIAAELPRGKGELAIFWVWFTGDGAGMLFTEGNYMFPTSHNLQLIDYTRFVRDATFAASDFSNPCQSPAPAATSTVSSHGHVTDLFTGRK